MFSIHRIWLDSASIDKIILWQFISSGAKSPLFLVLAILPLKFATHLSLLGFPATLFSSSISILFPDGLLSFVSFVFYLSFPQYGLDSTRVSLMNLWGDEFLWAALIFVRSHLFEPPPSIHIIHPTLLSPLSHSFQLSPLLREPLLTLCNKHASSTS